MINVITLAPSAALLAGVLLVLWAPPRLVRWQRELPWLAALLAVLMASGVVLAAQRVAPAPLELRLSTWSDVPLPAGPALWVDRMAALTMLLLCVVVFLGCLRARVDPGDPIAAMGPLVVASAAVLFVASACQLLGLVFAWLGLDVAIFLAAGHRKRSLLVSQLGLLLVLAGAVGIPVTSSTICVAQPGGLVSPWRDLLVLAGLVRIGLYPFWWSIPRTDPFQPWKGTAMRLVPTLAGAYLVLRVVQFSQVGEGPNTAGLVFALVAIVFGAFLTVLARHSTEEQDWATTVQAGLVCLAASYGGPVARAIALVIVLDLVIGRTAEFVFLEAGLEGVRVARWSRNLAALSLAGVPPTLGFAGRWLLVRELVARRAIVSLGLVLLAAVLTTPRLLSGKVSSPRAAVVRRWRPITVLLAVLGSLAVLLGVGFAALEPLLVELASRGLSQPLGEVVSTFRQLLGLSGSPAAFEAVAVLAAVLVAPLLGFALQRAGWPRRAAFSPAGRSVKRGLLPTALIRRLLASVVRSGQAVLRRSGLAEARRTMAWTLLAVVLTGTAMIVVLSPARRAPIELGTPTVLAALFFLAAAVITSILVLSRGVIAPLSALAAGYVLEAALLAVAGDLTATMITLAFIKLLVGAIVVGILVISLLQDPRHQRLAEAAQRMRVLRGPAVEGQNRILPALAVLVGLVLSYGLHSSSLAETLPDAVLHPAAALIAGGLLSLVFARSALRIVVGVLLALVGFELIYARLDAGLVVTGGLAAFQLLFAIVASSFVGLGAEAGEDA